MVRGVDRPARSGPLLNFISREILPGGGRMKEAIRDCTAISYFDRYPVIRSFGYNEEETRGQKRRVRRDGEGGGGEKRRKKKYI